MVSQRQLEEKTALEHPAVVQRITELKTDLRNALALLRYCFDTNDIPVIYTVESCVSG